MKVYLLDYRPESVLKIGYSNDPKQRRKDLSDGPVQSKYLQLLETTTYGDAKILEKLLHEWYQPYQSLDNGKEYFDLPSEIRTRLTQRFSVPTSVIPGYWFFLLGDPVSYLQETHNEIAWWDAQPLQKEQLTQYRERGYSAAEISEDIPVNVTESVVALGLNLLSAGEKEETQPSTEPSRSPRSVGQQTLTAFVESESAATPASTTWRNVEELHRLIHEKGQTYKEIAERSGVNATPDKIGQYARQHDINPGRGRRKYTGNEVTVDIGSEGNLSIPIPEKLTHKLQLAEEVKRQKKLYRMKGKIVAYYIGIENEKVYLYLDAGIDRDDRKYSNERTIAHRPGNRHVLARPPKVVAEVLELDKTFTEQGQKGTEECKQSLRDVSLEIVDERILKMDFSPVVEPVKPNTPPRPIWDKGRSPEIQVKMQSLHPIGPRGAAEKGEGIEKYRLDIPADYHRYYSLTGESEVGVSLTGLDGKPSILFQIGSSGQSSQVTRSIQSSPTVCDYTQSQPAEQTRYDDQRFLSPPLPLIHAMGMQSKRPEVTLIPGEDWFAVQPVTKHPEMRLVKDL